MSIPKNKAELLKAIRENYDLLSHELNTISPALADKKDLEGHSKNTKMSVNNLVAYLIGWGQLVLKWNNNKTKGRDVDFPETGFQWNELGLLARKFYGDYDHLSFKMLQKKLKETVNKILSLAQSKTNKELYGVAWYKQYTLGRMIQLNTASPYKNARGRIRKWKNRNLKLK